MYAAHAGHLKTVFVGLPMQHADSFVKFTYITRLLLNHSRDVLQEVPNNYSMLVFPVPFLHL